MSVQELPVDKIKPFLDRQSRKDDFERLKDSIARNGVLVPIQVTPLKKRKKGRKGKTYDYQLVWGHRRLRAAKEIGLPTIPSEVISIDDKERVKRFFIENEARKQLTAYEIAQLMEADHGKLSISEISAKYSMTESTVRGILRTIENASPTLRKHLNTGNFSFEDAKAITMLPTHREQTLIINRAIDKGFRGRTLKKEVRSIRTFDSVSKKAINARNTVLISELRNLSDEKDKLEQRYINSVMTLVNALNNEEFRQLLKKSKVDYSAFWSE